MTELEPLCLVVEDLHWLDPTSRELLDRLIGSIVESKLLLVLTTRDGFEAPWIRGRDTMVLQLKSLSPADVDIMVHSLFGGRPVPPPLARLIARKTDGVPLFIEEVGRSVLLAQTEAGSDSALVEISEQAIPASLHELLMARLDRSGIAKDVAQIAAVVGRSVRRDVLAVIAAMPDDALNRPLAQLVEAGVLYPDTVGGDEGYSFTHALLRDAAYDSLLRDDRQMIHLAGRAGIATKRSVGSCATAGVAGTAPVRSRTGGGGRKLVAGSGAAQPGSLSADRGDAPAAPRPVGARAAAGKPQRFRSARSADGAAGAGIDRAARPGSGGDAGPVRECVLFVQRHGRGPIAFPDLPGAGGGCSCDFRERAASAAALINRAVARRVQTAAAGASLQLGDGRRCRRFHPLLPTHRSRA